MNKFKRITAMFMAILTLFSGLSMMTVNAATEGTKTTIDASYRCYKGSDVGTSGRAIVTSTDLPIASGNAGNYCF